MIVMGNFIDGDGFELDSILYRNQNPNNMNLIKNMMDTIPSYLIDTTKGLYQKAIDRYNYYFSHEAEKRRQKALNASNTYLYDTSIRRLSTVEEVRNSSLTMQRWVMAEPTIRSLWVDQRVDGFSDTYQSDRTQIGENHYEYRMVMDGVVLEGDDDVISKHYIQSYNNGDRELTSMEKFDILSTWDLVKLAASKLDEDPTSIYEGKIG